uniref:Putative isac anti-complement n=1 Tax=Ixodes ricinus TaxID=34613 RepID=A0A0K8R9V7_IXORI
MEAALIRMLLGTAFVGMQLSPYTLVVAYNKSLYEKVLGKEPGICGAWYRNPNQTEKIMDCVLRMVPAPVKDQWERFMDDNCLTKTELVSEMCNLTTIMPGSFTNYKNQTLTKEYNDKAQQAGIKCTSIIAGTTKPQRRTAHSRGRGQR